MYPSRSSRAPARRAGPVAWVAILGALAAGPAVAQDEVTCPPSEDETRSGGLAGFVRDGSSGLILPGAQVLAAWAFPSGERGSTAAQTDGAGVYRLCFLPTGIPVYLQASFAGYATEAVQATLEAGPPAGWDFAITLTGPPTSASLEEMLPGRVVGRIRDRSTGRPVEAVDVALEGSGQRRLTDGYGRFAFRDLTPGVYTVRAKHLAYEDLGQVVEVPANRTVAVDIELSADPIELEPIVITAVRDRRLETKGFYERREIGENVGLGFFFDQEQIRQFNPQRITHVLSRIPGIRVECSGRGLRTCFVRMLGGQPSLSRRAAGGCVNTNVYIDGVRVIRDNQSQPESIDNFVLPSEVAGLEVYRDAGELPAEFGGSVGRCGAIVIWTGSGNR